MAIEPTMKFRIPFYSIYIFYYMHIFNFESKQGKGLPRTNREMFTVPNSRQMAPALAPPQPPWVTPWGVGAQTTLPVGAT